MRNLAFVVIILLLLLLSCGNQQQKKPANLISEDLMSEIIFDVLLISSAK